MLTPGPYQQDQGISKEKRSRPRLVVHTKTGKVAYGFCLSLNKNADAFNLELVDKENVSLGKSMNVAFGDVKGVFTVKSFDGRFDPSAFVHEMPPDVVPVVLEFFDGEVISGYASPKYTQEARFFFYPDDTNGNNISVLVERTALTSAMAPKEYKRKLHQEFEAFMANHVQRPNESKTELEGDFYFDKGNYFKALKHYREVEESGEPSSRLQRKVCATLYNVAVCHIRKHDYDRAIRYMEMVLARDPSHESALKRLSQLREHVSKRKVP